MQPNTVKIRCLRLGIRMASICYFFVYSLCIYLVELIGGHFTRNSRYFKLLTKIVLQVQCVRPFDEQRLLRKNFANSVLGSLVWWTIHTVYGEEMGSAWRKKCFPSATFLWHPLDEACASSYQIRYLVFFPKERSCIFSLQDRNTRIMSEF